MDLRLIQIGILRCAMIFGLAGMAAPPECSDAGVTFSSDYRMLLGSATYADVDGDEAWGCTYAWWVNGVPTVSGSVANIFHAHFDGSLVGTGGEMPVLASGLGYESGRWASGLAVEMPGGLSYARERNFEPDQGTIMFWVALRASGQDPVYADRSHYLFFYESAGGDYIAVVSDRSSGVLYAGGETDGQWQSAWNQAANTRSWEAMEWHHVAYCFSAPQSFMRFYLDGRRVADTNEGFYLPPAADGPDIFVGCDPWNRGAHCVVDEFRVFDRPLSADEIASDAAAQQPPGDFQQMLASDGLSPGDLVVFEFTPANALATGVPCSSQAVVFPGIPLSGAAPQSTLLPPGSDDVWVSVTSVAPTQCAYAVGTAIPFAQMTPFDIGAGTTDHQTQIPLDPDPNTVNEIFIRCENHPDFLLHLRYRVRCDVDPSYPRTGNLWGFNNIAALGPEAMAKIDLFLGASASGAQIQSMRQQNPDVLVLTSINAVENRGLPDAYYLKDINGNRIEVWPGSYRLNLTKFEVAEYQADFAYQTILGTDLMADGCFFDNVMTTQSWLTHDIYGNPVFIDADENGIPDDPEVLDAAWKAGVFHEMETFIGLMPDAIVNGHAMNIAEEGIGDLFHGISIGFSTADVIEGKRPFSWLWETYEAWFELARSPQVTMIESSPPDVLAYGYDYAPWNKIPAETLEFARTFYPYVRFGLALTLMQDGYFAHEFGDTWHGNAWWYDELDVDLGMPLGPTERAPLGNPAPDNLIDNPGFEDPITVPWQLWANSASGCEAQGFRDTTQWVAGEASARIEVTATSGTSWHVDFAQFDRTLTAETNYRLRFWAKADVPRHISVASSQGVAPWQNYGLSREIAITTQWREYTTTFQANTTASDARIQFFLGAQTGTVWLDEISLTELGPDVFTRAFDRGLVVLNGSFEPQDVPLGYAYQRFYGDQAPKVQFLAHDEDPTFSMTGDWTDITLDSGEWQASGPFYHDWGDGCRKSSSAGDWASWHLPIPLEDTYTIEVWWPDAPERTTWSQTVSYQVIADGIPIASNTLDQTQEGDRWRVLASVALAPDQTISVRAESLDGLPCIADALHITSQARYNNGSLEPILSLQPMDGIVLVDAPPGNCPHSDLDVVTGPQAVTCEQHPVSMSCTASGGIAPYQYAWEPAAYCDDPHVASPSVSPPETTVFSVIVTDDEGCKMHDDVQVIVVPEAVGVLVWLWHDPTAYLPDWDFDDNGSIDVLDLVAAVSICHTPKKIMAFKAAGRPFHQGN